MWNNIAICVEQLPINGEIDLLKAVYNRIVKDFNVGKLSFDIHTFVEAPAGSGLGTSSTLVVAVLGAFVQWLKLPLAEYDIASLAYSIEREDMTIYDMMPPNHCELCGQALDWSDYDS